MKKLLLVSALVFSANTMADTSYPAVNQKADPNDPCTIVMCMAGKVMGASGGSDCNDAIKNFFAITSFKKHHRFNPGATASMRKRLLGKCSSAGASTISGIISKFGRIRG